jgi:hypothetical protein
MGLSRLLWGWVAVAVWLLLWELIASRLGRARGDGKLRRARVYLGEALLLTLFGALWFGSLGAGQWWLVFGLVGALREWPDPISVGFSLLRVTRTLVAGGLLAWRMAPV